MREGAGMGILGEGHGANSRGMLQVTTVAADCIQ